MSIAATVDPAMITSPTMAVPAIAPQLYTVLPAYISLLPDVPMLQTSVFPRTSSALLSFIAPGSVTRFSTVRTSPRTLWVKPAADWARDVTDPPSAVAENRVLVVKKPLSCVKENWSVAMTVERKPPERICWSSSGFEKEQVRLSQRAPEESAPLSAVQSPGI
jgi:hypothetical protein